MNSDLEEGELSEVSAEEHEIKRSKEATVDHNPNEEEELMQYPILPVRRPVRDVPENGEEYLFMVMEERNALPKVHTMKESSTKPKFLKDLLPKEKGSVETRYCELDQAWVNQVIATFMDDRKMWEGALDDADEIDIELPRINDEVAWKKYFNDKPEPSLDFFVEAGHVLKMRLLLYYSRWLAQENGISQQRYLWLYCLLANTLEGISSDEMSIIRTLGKTCLSLHTDTQKVGAERLQAIVAIVARFFRQSDLIKRR